MGMCIFIKIRQNVLHKYLATDYSMHLKLISIHIKVDVQKIQIQKIVLLLTLHHDNHLLTQKHQYQEFRM